MEKTRLLKLGILFVYSWFLPVSFAHDYTQWGLPEGAKFRIGKGWISEIACSPSGDRIAVASSIGVWLYDAHSGAEISLLTGHRGVVRCVAFSAGWAHACQWELGSSLVGCSHWGTQATSHWA